MVSAIPTPSATNEVIWWIQERVKEQSNGELIIKYLGGPEVIGRTDQGVAVQRGVVDISYVFTGVYAGMVPGILGILGPSRLTAAEERASGFIDYFSSLYDKAGLKYLGRGEIVDGVKWKIFALFLNKKIERPQEIAGMKIGGTSPTINPFITALGAVPITNLSTGEVYTALDTGVVDGAWRPITTAVAGGWHEVFKYYIDHTFYKATMTLIMNPESWDRLPPHLQTLLQEVIIEVENEMPAAQRKWFDRDLKKATDIGVEIIRFSPEDEKWFLDLAYESEWGRQFDLFPEFAPKFKELLTRK